MWSGASVAHKAPVQEDLGLILTLTQMALLDLFFSLLSDNRLKNDFINF
jgi:hypothetical protein